MHSHEHLQNRLRHKEIILMDGGMGTEILRRGVPTTLPLWSAEALLTHPEVVQRIHEDSIRAGAEIIITNTFRTTRWAFAKNEEQGIEHYAMCAQSWLQEGAQIIGGCCGTSPAYIARLRRLF
jgi:S-methylmethionine-dependent homocysteine/selenocysteine methylase